jgi:ribosomal protein L37AE/L43A
MDITFVCESCGQSIVVDEAAAGLQAQCPKCAASITVPSRPSVDVKPSSPPASASAPEKQCPFCAETIKREARVCRFCGYNLETGQPGQASHPKSISPPTVKAESSVESGVKLGVGMFIVLPLMIIGVIIGGVVLLLLLGGLAGLVSFLWDHLIAVLSILVPALVIIWAVFALVRKRGNATHSRVLVVSGMLFLVAVSYQAWIGYEKERNREADQRRDEHEQEMANSFVGITEQELIRRLGQPKEVRREPDGSLRSLVYEDSNTNVEMFIINGEDGLVSGGEYRGHVFHR